MKPKGNVWWKMGKMEMNCYFLSNQTSIAEAKYLSAIDTRIISYINGKLLISQQQDSVIGGYLFTKDNIQMDDMFLIRMHANSKLQINQYQYSQNEFISGKEMLSLNFPNLSFETSPKYWKKEFEQYIGYKNTDKKLKIELGKITSGYFDESGNEYLKIVALNYNPVTAMNTIFSTQQTILKFNQYTGFSVGFNEIKNIDKEQLNQMKNQMMTKGYEIMQNYANNMYGNMLDKTATQEFQEKLQNCFFNDGIEHIMKIAQIEGNQLKNNLLNLALTGSKGSVQNVKQMVVQIGQIKVDGQFMKPLFHDRINMFFKKHDMNPLSAGIVMNSYLSGLTPQELLINSTSERVQMLVKVLSVSKPGSLGRKLIKNTENIYSSNTRLVCKPDAIYQELFGFDGFQVQTLSKIQIPKFYGSKSDFIQWYEDQYKQEFTKTNFIHIQKTFKKHLEELYQLINHKKLQQCKSFQVNNQVPMTDTIQLPVTVKNIVDTQIQQILKNRDEQNIKLEEQDYVQNLEINLVIMQTFCDNLKYVYFNEFLKKRKEYIPEVYIKGVNCINIGIKCILTPNKLKIFKHEQFIIMLKQIELKVKESLIPSGQPIGVLTSQSFLEYLTQDLLDAIHKMDQDQTTDPIDNLIDIFNNRTPSNLVALNKVLPEVRIPMRYTTEMTQEEQREMANQIANKLIVITLNSLLYKWEIIMTNIENESELNYQEDQDILQQTKIPDRCSPWCFRIVINKSKLFVNSIVIEEIAYILKNSFDVFVIYHQLEDRVVIRIYLGESYEFNSANKLKELLDDILQFNLRGIKGIVDSTVIKEQINTYCDIQQKIIKGDRFVILTSVNDQFQLRDIMEKQIFFFQYIDFSSITCNNHTTILNFFGKVACHQKIQAQIKTVFGTSIDNRHISFISQVMIQQGKLSILDTDGIKQRNKDAPLISLSESRASMNLVNCLVGNKINNLQSLSDQSIAGQVPKIGSTYNDVMLNKDFIMNRLAENQQLGNI